MENMDEIKRYLVDMKSEMIANGSKLSRVSDDVSLLKTTIIGLPETDRPGLVHDISQMKEKINSHDNDIRGMKESHFKEKVIIGTGAAGAGAAIGAVTKVAWWKAIGITLATIFKQ